METATLSRELSYMFDESSDVSVPASRNWRRELASYRTPDLRRSAFELVLTLSLFIALWIGALLAHSYSYLLALLFIVPAAGCLMRLFMIQHDCGHGAFFGIRSIDDSVGRLLGVLTLTPYDVWRHHHALHHATSGNLARRGTGDIHTLTISEYEQLSAWGRLGYRIYRHPLALFCVGPILLFGFQHRLPLGLMRSGARFWISAMATNAGIAVAVIVMIHTVGAVPFLLIHLPITAFAAAAGVWLFFVQHQFEETYWSREERWNHDDAALRGSSYYDLPGVLRWITANIGIHHVHHLSSRIPYYRLPEVLRDHPELANVPRLTILQSIACVRLKLWDEEQRKLVPFSALKRSRT